MKERIQVESVGEQGAERIFGPKGEEVAGEWRKLRNKKHHSLPSSQNKLLFR
jgi:hypothetical protein